MHSAVLAPRERVGAFPLPGHVKYAGKRASNTRVAVRPRVIFTADHASFVRVMRLWSLLCVVHRMPTNGNAHARTDDMRDMDTIHVERVCVCVRGKIEREREACSITRVLATQYP